MGFAEVVSKSCHSSNLKAEDGRIGSIEHVAALSGASSIGSDMMRAKDLDMAALSRAAHLLASKVHHKLKLPIGTKETPGAARRLSEAALLEVICWQCRACKSGSEQIIGGVRQACKTCGGTGVHRWTDSDRSKAADPKGDWMMQKNWNKWAKKYEQVLSMARLIDSSTLHQVRKRLG